MNKQVNFNDLVTIGLVGSIKNSITKSITFRLPLTNLFQESDSVKRNVCQQTYLFRLTSRVQSLSKAVNR